MCAKRWTLDDECEVECTRLYLVLHAAHDYSSCSIYHNVLLYNYINIYIYIRWQGIIKVIHFEHSYYIWEGIRFVWNFKSIFFNNYPRFMTPWNRKKGFLNPVWPPVFTIAVVVCGHGKFRENLLLKNLNIAILIPHNAHKSLLIINMTFFNRIKIKKVILL